MLSSLVLNRTLIASGALWCAAGISAGLLRPTANNAPLPAAASAAVVANEIAASKSDRLPLLAPELPFAGRWPVMATEPEPAPTEKSLRRAVPQHHVKRDRVCEKGRRYFTRHRHRYWKCRR